jgi:hypothetical protein
MARIKIVELDKIKESSIDANYINNIYIVRYPFQSNIDFICFSWFELGKELKKIQNPRTPTIHEVLTFGTPKIKKIPLKLYKEYLK